MTFVKSISNHLFSLDEKSAVIEEKPKGNRVADYNTHQHVTKKAINNHEQLIYSL